MENMCKKPFAMYLDSHNIRYQEAENIIAVTFGAQKNLDEITVYFVFDSDGTTYVKVICFDIGYFGDDLFVKGLVACNEMNKQWRWCRFYINHEKKVVVDIDAILNVVTAGDDCYDLLIRIKKIVDDSYPAFMKIRWSTSEM